MSDYVLNFCNTPPFCLGCFVFPQLPYPLSHGGTQKALPRTFRDRGERVGEWLKAFKLAIL